MGEIEKIAARYERRKSNSSESKAAMLFSSFIHKEREEIYKREILRHFGQVSNLKVLEIGAGSGGNIRFFKSIGILPSNISANELLAERIKQLRINHPDVHIIEGDACEINVSEKFDIVFQSTVFTSILDEAFKKKLADKMQSLVSKDGIILWYDFIYDNPSNKDVKGVNRQEVNKLFNACKHIVFFSVTLAPPLGRRVGKLYTLINSLFPFLRSHLIAVIQC